MSTPETRAEPLLAVVIALRVEAHVGGTGTR